MFKKQFLLLLLVFTAFRMFADDVQSSGGMELSLQGIWKFKMDPQDKGISGNWFNQSLSETIVLPASMTERGLGDPVTIKTNWTASLYDSSWYFNSRMVKYRQPGNLKFPFFLTPVKYFVGAAWYQKEIEIPANWKGKHVVLFLERAHWETTVWID